MQKQVLILFVVFALAAQACAVNTQKSAIRDARLAVGGVGVAVEAADRVTAIYYADKPASDDKSYCENKIASVIFRQAVIVLNAAADSIALWEQALMTYLARKEAGGNVDNEWDSVLSSEAEWLKVAVKVIAVLDGAMRTMKLWGVPIPKEVDYAWSFIYGMTGKPAHASFEFDWSAMKESICMDYLPGGGS